LNCLFTRVLTDFPRVAVGPENPLRVEVGDTAQLECSVDAKPSVATVKWTREGRFIDTHFRHTIPRVTLQDAGGYVCAADNGLGQVGKAELTLDVQHAPSVTLPASMEAKAGKSVTIDCQVAANPEVVSVIWTRIGDDSFSQSGSTLRLDRVTSRENGRYVCTATNYIQTTGGPRTPRTGNATVDVNIRHAPGKAFVSPSDPIAVDGRNVTLKCGANPPGFPKPTYSWWREGNGGSHRSLASGSEFTIDSVRLSSAGRYFCKPSNELGEGTVASVRLEVSQAPKLVTRLQANMEKKAGDAGFQATCSAVGKPRPQVRWFKDGLNHVQKLPWKCLASSCI